MSVNDNIMVTVCVFTYNQEQWIRQTLESVVKQQTDYPFEIIIGEDHGTDGTRAICMEYADKYDNVKLLPSPRNFGVTANWIHCIQAGTGKYIMTCAGDDFWHNPHKIQLQVDFMEKHPQCVMCYSEVDYLYEESHTFLHNVLESKHIIPPQGRIQEDILCGGSGAISAVTTCIRRSVFEEHIPIKDFLKKQFPREDWPTWLILSAHGDILYQPVSTATYRIGQESITRTSDYEAIIKRAQKDKEMTKYLFSLFSEWGPFTDEQYFDNIGYHNALRAAYRNNDYPAAHRFAKIDKKSTWAKCMAYTKPTFKLFRWLQNRRKKL